uniref:Uncharacterized protein n=1 Tax=Chromera velia CCMP2878 TaxID=1169474 RepID=A0A0G4IAY9_9ALVE|mmetsp:Transcript_13618/g.27050  ORF Transcript_13618/g.27050 Transcript_13618/m.27050 type:complete len:634 (+) Transcript_13618:104-2005(+)|eukprot:Cvel_2144.t1-p1 / transcript=Cvel_2144.t1 / gene=Cvel_2144 / organism=Chromera_velia_CCMP2878 / gene_product=hypothetical protein / transcript_product=hypothetical protein / location=Cvel_scaffold83:61699-63597(+) / protein_length=633 / sequence_SO=supercontig / SO=protein_coding / is_pseudo=false
MLSPNTEISSLDEIIRLPVEERENAYDVLVQSIEERAVVIQTVARRFCELLGTKGVEAKLHGSWAQGTALMDSDCDIECPLDEGLRGTLASLEDQEKKPAAEFVVERRVKVWRLHVRHRPTDVLLDVTNRARCASEPYWKTEHVRRSLDSARDGNVRRAVLLLKLWVRDNVTEVESVDGYPNTYTFLFLFLFFCTHRDKPVVPILSCKWKELYSSFDKTHGSAEPFELSIQPQHKKRALCSEDPLELLFDFFHFLMADLTGARVDFSQQDSGFRPALGPKARAVLEESQKTPPWTVIEPFTDYPKMNMKEWREVRDAVVSRARQPLTRLAVWESEQKWLERRRETQLSPPPLAQPLPPDFMSQTTFVGPPDPFTSPYAVYDENIPPMPMPMYPMPIMQFPFPEPSLLSHPLLPLPIPVPLPLPFAPACGQTPGSTASLLSFSNLYGDPMQTAETAAESAQTGHGESLQPPEFAHPGISGPSSLSANATPWYPPEPQPEPAPQMPPAPFSAEHPPVDPALFPDPQMGYHGGGGDQPGPPPIHTGPPIILSVPKQRQQQEDEEKERNEGKFDTGPSTFTEGHDESHDPYPPLEEVSFEFPSIETAFVTNPWIKLGGQKKKTKKKKKEPKIPPVVT